MPTYIPSPYLVLGGGLQYATSRTNRLPDYPIDNIGIEPNKKIPEEKNWVEFAVEYLKEK
jgi:hypothetical protein